MVSLVSVGKVGDGFPEAGLEPDMVEAGYVKEKGKLITQLSVAVLPCNVYMVRSTVVHAPVKYRYYIIDQ